MATSLNKSGKRLGLGVVLLAVLAVVVLFQLRPQAAATAQDVHADLIANASVPAQVAFFEQISKDYPIEFAGFLEDMADAVNDADNADASFALGVDFTQKLRSDNASFIANAPTDALREIGSAGLALLGMLADHPEVCGRFALMGGDGLSLDQAEILDMTAMSAVSSATFKAMVAGRDSPVIQPNASDADIVRAFTLWAQQPNVTDAMNAALVAGDPSHPDQCAAQTSFQRFIVESDDPAVIRAMVRLITLTVAQ